MQEQKVRKKKSRIGEIWRQLKKNKIAVISLWVIVFVVLVAIFAPLLAPYSYEQQDRTDPFASPSIKHLLGTDKMGRDVFSRLIWGSRQSLQIGAVSTAISAIAGIILGAIAGYYGGWLDNLLMRLLDIYQSIPMFLLCVTFAAVLGPSLRNAVIAIGISMVPGFARLMRASILSIREMEYVEAARSINASNGRIIRKHIIPNAISPLIVSITMGVGSSALAGAGLSFIGLGVQPPIPEWGGMISDARSIMRAHGELAMYPGICVIITVLAFNLLGDGLRDALDPRLKN
ncbi:MAG: ABC transporter permease [Oscillospiraceae bacterium]|jgi:peptide/nickel transport system permease protein|nr:ABC transporter permease [Oscillospiraceae bacterium]